MNDDSLHTYAAPIIVRTTFTAIKRLFATAPVSTFSSSVAETVARARAAASSEAEAEAAP